MSITLKLNGFRCYDDERVFTFEIGQVVTIRGRSGIGKTTILEAFQWVLYKYPTTNIDPRSGKGKNTSVQLSIPFQGGRLIIERRKNPGLLQLTYPDGHVEEDDVAQASLNNLFGERDLWRTCSYLPQNENCPLLSFSNAQRTDILGSLTFLNDKPDEDLNRVVEEINRLQGIFNYSNGELKSLKDRLSQYQLDDPDQLLVDNRIKEEAKARRESLVKKLRKLEDDAVVAEERKSYKNRLSQSLRDNQDKYNRLEVVTSDDLIIKEEELKILQADLIKAERAEMAKRTLARRDELVKAREKINPPLREYSHDEYQEALTIEKKISDEKSLAACYKISYDKEEVRRRITLIKTTLDGQKEAQIWARIIDLEDKLGRIKETQVTEEDVNKAREEVRNLERSVDVVKCPSCKRGLRYLRNNLVLAETSPVPLERLNRYKKGLTEMEASYREMHEKKILLAQRDSLLETVTGEYQEGVPLGPKEIKKLEDELVALTRLVFPSPPEVSSSEIRQAHDYFRLSQDIEAVEAEIRKEDLNGGVGRSIKEIKTSILACQDRIKFIRDLLPRRDLLTKQIKEGEKEIAAIVIPEINPVSLSEIKETINEIDLALEEIRVAEEYVGVRKEAQAKEEEVNEINKELGAAIRLKDLIHHEISDIINEKISTINILMSEICNKIFLEPITVELDMLKTTKTTKVTKPCVHLKIWYKNGEYDGINQLSGGEGKRISLAVSLAISQLNSFPVILLDECLNGLDDELKENVLEVIKEVCHDKAVIVISHDSLGGYFDETIELVG